MDASTAYRFLAQYGGIDFLMQHYDIEHTLSLDDAVDDLEHICRQNGGVLQSTTFHTEKSLKYLQPAEG